MTRIETIARALAKFWHNNWDTMSDQAKEMYLDAAEAVIDADPGEEHLLPADGDMVHYGRIHVGGRVLSLTTVEVLVDPKDCCIWCNKGEKPKTQWCQHE